MCNGARGSGGGCRTTGTAALAAALAVGFADAVLVVRGAILLFFRFRNVLVERSAKHAEARRRDIPATGVIAERLAARASGTAAATTTTLQRVAAGAHRGFDPADGETLDHRSEPMREVLNDRVDERRRIVLTWSRHGVQQYTKTLDHKYKNNVYNDSA